MMKKLLFALAALASFTTSAEAARIITVTGSYNLVTPYYANGQHYADLLGTTPVAFTMSVSFDDNPVWTDKQTEGVDVGSSLGGISFATAEVAYMTGLYGFIEIVTYGHTAAGDQMIMQVAFDPKTLALLPASTHSALLGTNQDDGLAQVQNPVLFSLSDPTGLLSEVPVTPMPSSIPEPMSWMIMCCGLMLLGAVLRFRSKAVPAT